MQILNRIQQYIVLMRLNNLTGSLLLYWPCAWGLLIANKTPPWTLFLLFFLGSVVMRSAGCIINDIFDREFDKKVQRTSNRPLAKGSVSIYEAIFLIATLSLIGLYILLQLNTFSIYLGFSSTILVVIYPLMKRITFFPQMFLGFTFNFGILIGYSAIQENLSLSIIITYFSAVFWTIGYDTIYGFQDIQDDKKIGVKSAAIFCEKFPKLFIFASYSIFISFFVFSLYLGGFSISYYSIFILVLILTQMMWQVVGLNIESRKSCFQRFKSNQILALLILIFIASLAK